MKAAPTLEGGLRIDAEEKIDWTVLSLICADATSMPGQPLADKLSQQASTHPLSENEDWCDYVLPELNEKFSTQIKQVAKQIQDAKKDSDGKNSDGKGSLIIAPHQIDLWYGTLNQARLSLEEQYNITSKSLEELKDLERAALYRYEFYSHVQTWLINVMT